MKLPFIFRNSCWEAFVSLQWMMQNSWKETVQMADILLSLSSVDFTYIFSLIIKFACHWRRKSSPWATLSHQQYTLPYYLKRIFLKTENGNYCRRKCLIRGTTGANAPFKSFGLRWALWIEEGNANSFYKYLLRTFYKRKCFMKNSNYWVCVLCVLCVCVCVHWEGCF